MIELNPRYCKSCGYCIRFCPKKVLEMGEERNRRGYFYPVIKVPEACISCGICASVCPEAAITLPGKGEDTNG